MKRVELQPSLAPRRADSHKGDYGRVLLVAGSAGMVGAAVLAARSALRAGSGLVTVALPASLAGIVATASPEATQLLLPEPGATDFATRLGDILEANLQRFDAVGLGPGLGTSPEATLLVERIVELSKQPLVLDADGLNVLACHRDFRPRRETPVIWTPHPGEFRRLTGEAPRGDGERDAAARRFVQERGGVLVLKGHRTLVMDSERFWVCDAGNPGMATGGAGDVLTGVITSFLGQGLDAFDAAAQGVYVHGRAGDLAAERFGESSLIAGDVVDSLPEVLRGLGQP